MTLVPYDASSRHLPSDAVLLPVTHGALLVARSFATFCHVPTSALRAVERVLGGVEPLMMLPSSLIDSLELHGFFADPRPARPAGTRLKLQLTNRCNLDCHYCCTNSGIARANELTLDRWMQVLNEALDYVPSGLEVGLLGGEPLLVPGALELASHALARGGRVTLFTNGMLLSDTEIARRVADLHARGAEIRISLAGATCATCDRLSGAARFDQVLLGLDNLRRWGATARVDVMLFPETVDDVASNLATLREQLPSNTRLTFGFAFCGGREVGQHVFPSRLAIESALDSIAFEAGERIRSPARSPVAYRREACHCAFGHDLSVRSDGSLFTCFRMEEPEARFEPGALASVWQRRRSAPRLAAETSLCSVCPLATLCGGGCRSENLLTTGSGDVPDCGSWRVRVLCELLAEDCVAALEWTTRHLRAEAERRGIPVPDRPTNGRLSLHVL